MQSADASQAEMQPDLHHGLLRRLPVGHPRAARLAEAPL